MKTLITDSGVTISGADFDAAYAALEKAGVHHARIRSQYAEAVLVALAQARSEPCGATTISFRHAEVCAGPAGHIGWHASAPWVDDENNLHGGAVWSGSQMRA